MTHPDDQATLIFHIRPSRKRARPPAVMEASWLLHDLDPIILPGGPLSESGGVFWIGLREANIDEAARRMKRLGYTRAVDLLEPCAPTLRSAVRWRGRTYRPIRLYEEDPGAARDEAPDRRAFLLESAGTIRLVKGYRGDGGDLSRRGLPVCDARLLVNLTVASVTGLFLDPFAGIGGIVREAVARGCRALSCDTDPRLRHGLMAMGAFHCVADAARLPFPDEAFPAIATEPPYHPETAGWIPRALAEMARVLAPAGRLAVLCAAWQAPSLREQAGRCNLQLLLDSPVDRKGLEVVVLCWSKRR